MRRFAGIWPVMLLVALAAPMPVAAARTSTSYVSVTCFAGWEDPYWRPTGNGGLVEHDGAVITSDVWIYDSGAWRQVGTEVDTVMDESNARTGTELFRGSFVVSSTLGDFAGTFVWVESGLNDRGHGVGTATDGSGLLWKTDVGVVDPAATGVPACAADREIYNLTLLQIVAP